MLGLLWTIVAVLVILWILGLVAFHLGAILWIFLVAAIAVAIVSLFSGGRWTRQA
jgi:hypothetical protein